VTSALTKRIDDVNTSLVSDEPSGWSTPAGGGLHLITDYESDDLGRITEVLGPKHDIDISGTSTEVRRADWYVYKDDDQQRLHGRGYQKVSNSSDTLINPVSITQLDKSGRVTEEIKATRASTSGALTASDSFAQSTYVRWRTTIYLDSGQLDKHRVYHNIPSSGSGSSGTNYDQTDYGYDDMKRLIRTKKPGGTITRHVRNIRGWVEEIWVGTDDTGATNSNPAGSGSNNMKQTVGYEYDGNSDGGDGNVTKETKHVDASNTRVTTYGYDYRNRNTSADGEEDFYEAYTYDNLDRLTVTEQKDTTSGGSLVAKTETSYDDLGRVYLVENYSVSSGTAGTAIKHKTWYDATGNIIKTQQAGSRAFEKKEYNGVSWVTKSFVCYDADEADTDYTAAGTVTGDTVMQQTEYTYDDAGNVTRTETKQRFHDADGTTGELGTVTTQPKARISYLATFPDSIGRTQATANYGTNGGSSMSWPTTIPNRSDTVLVADTIYNDDGEGWKTIDPEDTENRREYDDAGRVTKTIENYVDGTPSADTDKTTEYTYNANGQIATLKAKNSTTGDQTTTWTYGTTLTDSDIASNELLRYVQYPDGSVSDRMEYKYNRQGQQTEIKDQNGNVRTLEYDKLGRLEHDRVTTLGSGVDGAVSRLTRSYEVRGMLEKISSYNNATVGSGSVVNEVQYAYNGFKQLTTEYQAHSGVVNTSTSPKVEYAYANGSNNTIRRTQISYPDGTDIDFNYGSSNGKDDMLSRVYQIKDGSTVLAEYSKLGVAQDVIVDYSGQPGVELTYLKQSGDATLTGDRAPGDDYYGLDRFGRVQDQRWYKSGTDKERVKYGYDRASNRQWRENTVAASNQDEYYTYDGLYQLDSLKRGNLTGTFPNYTGIASTPTWQEDFNYDATGNWNGASTGYQTQVNGTTTLNQNRTHNVANEITNITETTGTAWPTPTQDSNGNITVTPRPLDLGNSYDLKYDAWNRLVEVKNTGGSVVSTYEYDGINRRTTKDYSSVVRHYYYSDEWQILEERTDSNTTADRQFVWGTRSVDDLIFREYSSTRYYVLNDALGSVTAIVDTSGNVQERYGYNAFGEPIYMDASFGSRSSSSYGWETLFASYRYDLDSGMFQVRNRYLHPNLGRWVSRDPIGYEDGTNLYAYVGNGPVNLVDPKGLLSMPLPWWMAPAVLPNIPWWVLGSPWALGVAGGLVLAWAAYLAYQAYKKKCEPKKCPPCPAPPPPRWDMVPPSRPHAPCKGSHTHYFYYTQAPYPKCICRLENFVVCDEDLDDIPIVIM
jgi:RHS repeat-associated protein